MSRNRGTRIKALQRCHPRSHAAVFGVAVPDTTVGAATTGSADVAGSSDVTGRRRAPSSPEYAASVSTSVIWQDQTRRIRILGVSETRDEGRVEAGVA